MSRANAILVFGEPRWLRVLRVAAWMPILSVVALVVTTALVCMSGLSASRMDKIYTIGVCVAALSALAGCWLAMSPNPATYFKERTLSPRRIARGALLVCAADMVILAYVGLPMLSQAMIGIGLTTSPVGLAGAVAAWGLGRQYESIADTANNPDLVREAGRYRHGYLICWTLCIVSAVLMGAGMDLFVWVLGIAGLVGLVFGLSLLFFPVNLIQMFRKAREQAGGNIRSSEA